MSDSDDYECGLQDGLQVAGDYIRKDKVEMKQLRERICELVTILRKVEHTVSLHGHMDVGTELFDLVCAATSVKAP